MSVKVSLLKNAKKLVDNWLDINFESNYNLFYSLGTKEKSYKDQFLKIELDCEERLFGFYATKIREMLISENADYENLSMKIFSY